MMGHVAASVAGDPHLGEESTALFEDGDGGRRIHLRRRDGREKTRSTSTDHTDRQTLLSSGGNYFKLSRYSLIRPTKATASLVIRAIFSKSPAEINFLPTIQLPPQAITLGRVR